MSKATTSDVPADKLALYDKLLATNPNVERKGEEMPYTSLNGHMFSFLTPSGGLALRLPEPARREFLERYQTTLCEQHGAVMAEYVNVPETLFENLDEMSKHFDVAYMYVATLKPKDTTRATKSPASKLAAKSANKPARAAGKNLSKKSAAKTAKSAAKKSAAKPSATKAATKAKKPPAKKSVAKPLVTKAKKPAAKAKKSASKSARTNASKAITKAAKRPIGKTNHTPTRAPRKGAAKKLRPGAKRARRSQAA